MQPGDFDQRALGGQITGQAHNAADGGDRVADRADDVLILREHHTDMVLGQGLAGNGHAIAMQQPAIQQCLDDDRNAANLVNIGRHIAPTRLEVGDQRCASHDLGNVLQGEADTRLMRHGRQMQRGVRRTASGADDDRGIFQRLQRDDVARAQVAADEFHYRLAGFERPMVAAPVGRRRAGGMRQSQANDLGNTGHGVGGVLATAGALARAGQAFQLGQLGVRHFAGGVLADRLEHVDDRHVLAMELPRHDRAAIHEHARHVQPQHGHHHPRQGFVAAGQANQRIIAMAAHGEFHAVGDHLTRNQRGLHTLVTHGDTVGHRDGGELARAGAGQCHAALGVLRLARQRGVAGRRLVPAGGDADQRRGDILGSHAHGVVVAAMRRTLRANGHVAAGQAGLVPNRHGGVLP